MKAKVFCLLVAILFGFASTGYAQVRDYPKKQIQILIGHTAGSAIDVFYRLLAEEASKMWKVPVNSVNKPVASGSVAASEVANSEKDGYTLYGTLVGQLASVSIGNPKSPVHILRDFDPIEMHSYAANVLYVRVDSPFKSLEEIIDYARKKPGELLCGITQMGSNIHLDALLLNRLAKVDITLIHQDGPPEVMTGVLGGHFNLGWTNHVLATPHVTAGKIRVLASDIKCPLGVPTFADKGYPQIDLSPVMSLMGPKGMPPTVIRAWEDVLNTVMKDPRFLASINKLGFVINMSTGTEKLNELLKEEMVRYSRFTPEELGWKKK
jgi:tripartite-type tricarboxylate transporter receptor subunit TctC